MGGRPLHPEAWIEDEDDLPARRPPAPRGRKLRKPVTFLCPSVPALGLGLYTFDHGRLTLEYAEDVRRVRAHPWFGRRILEETPEVQAQLAADAALHRQLRLKDQEPARGADRVGATGKTVKG